MRNFTYSTMFSYLLQSGITTMHVGYRKTISVPSRNKLLTTASPLSVSSTCDSSCCPGLTTAKLELSLKDYRQIDYIYVQSTNTSIPNLCTIKVESAHCISSVLFSSFVAKHMAFYSRLALHIMILFMQPTMHP